MYPPGMPRPEEQRVGPSYSGVFVAADRDRVLAELAELRFSGYVGPQEGRWVVLIAGNPLGKVARKKRRIDDLARDLAAALGTVAMAAEVAKDERLRLLAFEDDTALPPYDSSPPEPDDAEITLDDFGNPVMGEGGAFVDGEMVAAALLTTFEVEVEVEDEDDDSVLADLLDDDLGEDTSESERLVGVLRILGLPTWIVSSDSLPKRVPSGPDKREVTRLGAGKPGVQGRLAEAVTRPARPRPRRDD